MDSKWREKFGALVLITIQGSKGIIFGRKKVFLNNTIEFVYFSMELYIDHESQRLITFKEKDCI